MKLPILGDLHLGARNDNIFYTEYVNRFFKELFIPYCIQNDIKLVIQLGDIFDRRKYMNFNTLNNNMQNIFDALKDAEIQMITILGNHDIYFKNRVDVNSPELLLKHVYPNLKILSQPVEKNIDGIDFLFLPWICDSNRNLSHELIANSKASYVIGHLELQGFEMQKGVVAVHGDDNKPFNKFDLVISGHYHHGSHIGNILYTGIPYEITWADYDDNKGFYVMETTTRELEFIKTPFNLFHKITYNDLKLSYKEVENFDYSKYTGTYVKVVVQERNKPLLYDTFITSLEKSGAIEVQVVEDLLQINFDNQEEILDSVDDIPTFFNKVIDQMNTIKEDMKGQLKVLMNDLYVTAHSVQ